MSCVASPVLRELRNEKMVTLLALPHVLPLEKHNILNEKKGDAETRESMSPFHRVLHLLTSIPDS
jgi:hypothetical protein